MKISVIGTGYVGLVTGVCFAEMGNRVTCVDSNREKIEGLKRGVLPIYEPGLGGMLERTLQSESIRFTDSVAQGVAGSEVVFIAVGTPMGEDGAADVTQVLAVAEEIGRSIARYTVVVDKSTVPVGTAERVRATIENALEERGEQVEFSVVSNPEFLKEGSAVSDCMHPDRVVIGTDDERALEVMEDLYKPFLIKQPRVIVMDLRSAEMTKYAANAMLATKISFINEIAAVCEAVGADVNRVRVGIGSDSRIGYDFIYPGCGYGGSCFPKDVAALIGIARQGECEVTMLPAVTRVNDAQKRIVASKVVERFGEDLSGVTLALWGLAFKPGTDDMREAPSIETVAALTERGARIKAYDPQAMGQARSCYLEGNDRVEYCDSKYDVLTGVDALMLLTEWKEFRSPDFEEIIKRMSRPVVFDGRNQFDPAKMEQLGFEYHCIGVRRGRPAGN